jgi:hypothetical protein
MHHGLEFDDTELGADRVKVLDGSHVERLHA